MKTRTAILGTALGAGALWLTTSRAVAGEIARPTAMALDPDGSQVFVVEGDNDRLVAVSTVDGAPRASAATGVMPVDLAYVPGRNEVWTICRFDERMGRFDADTLAPIGTIPVPSYCERIAVDPSGAKAYVSNSAERSVLIIDVATPSVVDRVRLPGSMPRDVLLDAEQGRLYVAQLLSESVAVVGVSSRTVLASVRVGAVPGGLALAGDKVVVGHLGLHGSTFDDEITNRISLIDRTTFAVSGDYEISYATPRATVYDPAAGRAWVACFGSDLAVEIDLGLPRVRRSVRVGPNPIDMATLPDGRLLVLNHLGDSVTVVADGMVSDSWRLNANAPDSPSAVLRGERVFNFAAGAGPNTCYSCHPGGQVDGLSRFEAPPNYLGSATVNTLPLRFVRWTPPYRRDGSVSSLGLHIANILPILREGAPVTDEEVTDLVAYLNSLGPEPNPFAKSDDDLTAVEQQGRAVFEQAQCGSCHVPMLYTDRRVYNVGTGGDADTPSLLGLWQTGPYLHDGRAATLADVFAPLPGRHLPAVASPAEREALAAYLLTLRNPEVFWSLPSQVAADGVAGAAVDVQVFDTATGRPLPGATVEIAETTGLAGVVIDEPPVTDTTGQTSGMIRSATPGIGQFRLLLNGVVATEERPLEFFAPAKSLVNVAAAAGVDFTMLPNAYPRAVAIADYDADGYPDIFVAVSRKNASGSHHIGALNFLMRNRGDGTFENATASANVAQDFRSSAGAAFGDYDDDGDLDLYVGNRGATPAALDPLPPDVPDPLVAVDEFYRNDGNGTFTEVAAAAGVANPGFGYAVLWFDYDHDGDLDLFNQNLWDCCNENNYTLDALYRNDGGGTFSDVSAAAGLPALLFHGGDGGAVGDYDNDGWQDMLLVPVNGNRLYLLLNEGDGTFSEHWAESGIGPVSSSRGLALGDFDNDLDLDLFIVGQGLYRNDGDGAFTNVTPQIGFDFGPYSGRRFGHTFVDLNNDGWLEIVAENRNSKMAVFLNQAGTGQFQVLDDLDPVLDAAADPRVGLGVLDYDLDGDMDVFLAKEGDTSTGGQPQVLYENRIANEHHFLRVTLEGSSPATPRSANGARVYVQTGELTQMREIMAGENASGCADYVQHFGLGAAALVDHVTVVWPSGKHTVYDAVSTDQHIKIVEGQSAWTVLQTWFDVDIAASPAAGPSPLTVQFSSMVLHPTGAPLYLWDFDDGGALGIGPAPVHTFANDISACVDHVVTLTASDAAGATATATIVITVSPPDTGDSDHDGDVDLADFAETHTCWSGPQAAPADCDCSASDADADGDVDLADIAIVFAVFTGSQ